MASADSYHDVRASSAKAAHNNGLGTFELYQETIRERWNTETLQHFQQFKKRAGMEADSLLAGGCSKRSKEQLDTVKQTRTDLITQNTTVGPLRALIEKMSGRGKV